MNFVNYFSDMILNLNLHFGVWTISVIFLLSSCQTAHKAKAKTCKIWSHIEVYAFKFKFIFKLYNFLEQNL